MIDKDKLIKKLKNMKQYRNMTDAEIDKIASKKIELNEVVKEFALLTNDEDKYRALELYEKYTTEKDFETFSERSVLIHLIELELIADKIKKYINEQSDEKRGIPLKSTVELLEYTERINDIKIKLGLLGNSESKTFLENWNILLKKTQTYYETHKGCNITKCPKCQTIIELRMRTEGLQPEECKWFKGTLLYNAPLFALFHNKIITAEQVAEILGTGTQYVEMMYQNIFLKEQNDK